MLHIPILSGLTGVQSSAGYNNAAIAPTEMNQTDIGKSVTMKWCHNQIQT